MARPDLPLVRPSSRRGRGDDLGLRRALGDRVLPVLVGAMAFLAALAMGGAMAAQALALHWQGGAAGALTVQVPQPDAPASVGVGVGPTRLDATLAALHASPAIASARALGPDELAELLRPWFGAAGVPEGLTLPAVIEAHLQAAAARSDGEAPALSDRLALAVPGVVLESHDLWVRRLAVLARSLQACAWLALGVVAAIAAMVIAVATRSGLVARREAIQIVHGLGATDGYIAGCFARRATGLAAGGAALGAAAALPVLLAMALLAAPFVADPSVAMLPPGRWLSGLAAALPPALWLTLPGLPAAAALIGWLTAQRTVRRWLRRLP